jgi:hypothetical protein
LVGLVRTGVTFGDAAEDYLQWPEFERDRKPATLRGYRTIVRGHLLPAFGTARGTSVIARSACGTRPLTLVCRGFSSGLPLPPLVVAIGANGDRPRRNDLEAVAAALDVHGVVLELPKPEQP